MKTLKIEAGKFYRTRDGRKAGIYRTDVNHPEYSIHGYIVESDGVEHPLSWTSNGRFFSTEDDVRDLIDTRDLIEKWQELLDFDWDCLPPWCNKYIAMDENGAWHAFSSEPTLGSFGFYDNNEVPIVIPEEYQPKALTGDWTDSVFKNPNLD